MTPANPSIPVGETQPFTATGTYSDNSTQDLTSQVTWASATTSVATISNDRDRLGMATGVGTGTSTISATLAGVTGSTVLTVTPRRPRDDHGIAGQPERRAGQTEPFMAMAMYSDNSTRT